MTARTEEMRINRLAKMRRDRNPSIRRKLDGISKRMMEARKAAGYTQFDAGVYVGFSAASSFGVYETGQKAWTIDILLLLCDLYGADVLYIISGQPQVDTARALLISQLQTALMMLEGES